MNSAKMKLSTKLGMGFGVVLLLSILVGVSGYWGTQSLSGTAIKEFHEMLQGDAAIAQHSARARADVLGLRRFEKDIFLNIGNKDKEEEYLKKWKEQYDHLLARMGDLEKAASLQQDKDSIKTMKTELATYNTVFNKVWDMVQTGKIKTPQEGNTAINEVKDEMHRLEEATKGFSDEGNKRMAGIENMIKASANRTAWIMTILTLVCVVLGVGISIFITRSITKPVNRIIEGLSDGSEQVASASSQVSSASQSLAEGASEQAAGLEETSSSIEEMASMTKQNADNANQANTLMAETSQVVNEANQAMVELTGSMKEITTASEETAKIIKTIDEIAFQTNLLALNAAVEAARAGEAGAGFAVVADEVRNLAMRASEAAKNTANLIEGSVKKIKNGSDIVTKTNDAFGKVATGAKKVGELVGEIAAASNEQSQGVEQINKAVAEMDKVVQKNAASAEESASAAEEMNAQAEEMRGFVGELVAVVGGSSNGSGNGVVSARASSQMGGNGKHTMAIDHQPKAKAMIHKMLSGNGKKEKAAVKEVVALKAKEVKPNQVIPMEEGDFKEF